MRKLVLLVLLTSVLLISGLNAKTFVVGVENINYYPFYSYSNGDYIGYGREVLDLFAKTKGYTFDYNPLPIKRLFHYSVEGKIDFKFPANPLWSQDVKKGVELHYSKPVAHYFEGALVLPKNKGTKIKDLGTIAGFTAWPFLDQIKSGEINLTENGNFKNLLLQGLNERVDAVFLNTAVADYNLSQMGKGGELVFDESQPHVEDDYLLSSKDHPEIINEFNQFLIDHKAEIDKLKKKFNIK